MGLSESSNVAARLPALAAQQPHRPAVLLPDGTTGRQRLRYSHLTFRQLNAESDRLAHGLTRHGIGPGTRAVLMVRPGHEFFTLTFALFKVGAVPVLVDPGMGIRNLGQCLAEAQPEAFVGVSRAHVARILFGWSKSTLRCSVTVGPRLFWGGLTYDDLLAASPAHAPPFPIAPTTSNDLAAILFTSGSTGVPKGAVYTHGTFAAQIEALRSLYRLEPGEIELATFVPFSFFAVVLGMTTVLPEMDFTRPAWVDPARIVATIENFGVEGMFGSPALLRRVGTYAAERGLRLPSLRRVVSAGAPVSAEVLECFAALLTPGVQIFTPYGATEALPVCSIGSDEILGETRYQTAQGAGVCVGRPVEGVRVEIITITDEPLAEWSESLRVCPGDVGEIIVRGPMVTTSYYNRPEATALAKLRDPADGGVWHRMGDLGRFDERGRLWFLGRKSQRVVIPGRTLFTIACEGVFNTHPKVARTALVDVAGRPILCVELRRPASRAERQRICAELSDLAARHEHTREITTFLFHPAFPVDIRHNAKIFREQLAVWAARRV